MEKEKIKAEEPEKIITLSDLALELGAYKSKLDYYYRQGLITPMETIGKVTLFAKQLTLVRLKKIKKLQKEGKTLKEIVEILKEE